MRVVLDTNVWLSAIFWEGEASRAVKLSERVPFRIVISDGIILEISDVLGRESKFLRFLEERRQSTEDLIATIVGMCELVDAKSVVDLVKEHPSDNNILSAAKDGLADYLVSYDNHLLKLGRFGKTKIISPGEFLEMTGASKGKKHHLSPHANFFA